jgi:hypothetical protein
MVIPHFRKGQVNGEIAVLGITKSVKKKPPVSGIIYEGGSYAQMTVISKGWKRRECPLLTQSGHGNRNQRCPLLGIKQTHETPPQIATRGNQPTGG